MWAFSQSNKSWKVLKIRQNYTEWYLKSFWGVQVVEPYHQVMKCFHKAYSRSLSHEELGIIFILKNERTPKDFQCGLNLRKCLEISVSVFIIQQRSSWVYLPVIVHSKWEFEKWNENFPQLHLLVFLVNLVAIWKCKDASVTEQGCSCLMSHLFTSVLQSTAIQSVFGLHCTSNINSCTFVHLLIVPFCVATIPLLTLYFLFLTLAVDSCEREKNKSFGISVCATRQ